MSSSTPMKGAGRPPTAGAAGATPRRTPGRRHTDPSPRRGSTPARHAATENTQGGEGIQGMCVVAQHAPLAASKQYHLILFSIKSASFSLFSRHPYAPAQQQ